MDPAVLKQIAFHTTEAHRLKQLYNSQSRIATLLPDILSEIFLEHAALIYRHGLAALGLSEVIRVLFEDSQCLETGRLVDLVQLVPEVRWDGRRVTLDLLTGSDAL